MVNLEMLARVFAAKLSMPSARSSRCTTARFGWLGWLCPIASRPCARAGCLELSMSKWMDKDGVKKFWATAPFLLPAAQGLFINDVDRLAFGWPDTLPSRTSDLRRLLSAFLLA
jgi:hypothetical protein